MSYNDIYTLAMRQWLTLNWHDYIEILFCSLCIYAFSCWLKKDRSNNLLGYFYGFSMVAGCTYALELSTVNYLLFIFSPAIVLLFITMHQDTLQKNLISLKNITTPASLPHDWMTLFTQMLLKSLNNNQPLLILLEHTDSLSPFVKTNYAINAPLSNGLIDLLFDTQIQSKNQFLWITSEGICKGINTTFKASWHPTSYKNNLAWLDDALAHTSKNDSLLIHTYPENHTCSLALKGKLHANLSVEQAHFIIHNHIDYHLPLHKKRIEYGIASKKARMEERSS